MNPREQNEAAQTAQPPQHSAKWERRDVDVVTLVWLVVLLAILGILAVLGSAGFLRFLSHQRDLSDRQPPAVAAERANFPPPRLELNAPRNLEKFRENETRELTTYDWIDREKKVVRIPIERAIELLSQRGLPQTNQRLTPLQLQQQRPQERSENESR